jgi:inosine-uridine nucleoside N-ribohydrolase
MRQSRVLTVVLALVVVAGTGCTTQQRRAISEAVVRNVVAFEAAKEFKNHGYPIHDHLVCKSKASRSDESHVGVLCSGTTTTGQTVAVAGTADTITGLEGQFVGLVNGNQVFRETCLGC